MTQTEEGATLGGALSAEQAQLLDSLHEAAVVATPAGVIAYVNAAARALLSRDDGDLVGRPILELVPSRFHSVHQAGFDRYRTTGTMRLPGDFLRVPVLCVDGSEIDVELVLNQLGGAEVDGVPPVLALIRPRDRATQLGAAGGLVLEMVSVLSEDAPVDEAVERLLCSIGSQLGWDAANLWRIDQRDAVIRCVGTWSTDDPGLAEFVAETRRARFGLGEGLPGRVWRRGMAVPVEDLGSDDNFPRLAAARRAGLRSGFGFPVEDDGRLVGVLELFRTAIGPLDEDLWQAMHDLTTSVGAFLSTVVEAEERARSVVRLRLLAQANEILGRSRDYQSALQEVTEVLVPTLADAAVIDLLVEDGAERVASSFQDPARAVASEAREVAAAAAPVPGGPRHVATTGQSVLHGPVSLELLQATHPTLDEQTLRLLVSRSTLIVPLIGRGHSLGALTLATFEREPALDEGDRAFAEELGRHLGLAVANAQLYEREHAVASALQQSLLPRALPEVPRSDVAARFRAGGDGLAVGGDFYDVFEAGENQWMVVVGDVCGTGAEAAAVTSQVRYTAQALAGAIGTPALLLERINEVLLRRGSERFCTAVAATVEPTEAGHRVAVACAGHPPPVVVGGSQPELLDACKGTLLGVYDRASFAEQTVELRDGDAIVFYTDGVTEAREPHGPLLGEDGLLESIQGEGPTDAGAIADRILTAATTHGGGSARDDIAILVVRRTA